VVRGWRGKWTTADDSLREVNPRFVLGQDGSLVETLFLNEITEFRRAVLKDGDRSGSELAKESICPSGMLEG
jgi:hypothetical protein